MIASLLIASSVVAAPMTPWESPFERYAFTNEEFDVDFLVSHPARDNQFWQGYWYSNNADIDAGRLTVEAGRAVGQAWTPNFWNGTVTVDIDAISGCEGATVNVALMHAANVGDTPDDFWNLSLPLSEHLVFDFYQLRDGLIWPEHQTQQGEWMQLTITAGDQPLVLESVHVTPAPEPAAIVSLSLGLLAIGWASRRKRAGRYRCAE